MPLPQFRESRDFWRAALERRDDAAVLEQAGRSTGAAYLSGYAVECGLKALLLERLPKADERQAMTDGFRGTRGHDLRWLRKEYHEHGGPLMTAEVERAFAGILVWRTSVRYSPSSRRSEAGPFLAEVDRILEWMDGRL